MDLGRNAFPTWILGGMPFLHGSWEGCISYMAVSRDAFFHIYLGGNAFSTAVLLFCLFIGQRLWHVCTRVGLFWRSGWTACVFNSKGSGNENCLHPQVSTLHGCLFQLRLKLAFLHKIHKICLPCLFQLKLKLALLHKMLKIACLVCFSSGLNLPCYIR